MAAARVRSEMRVDSLSYYSFSRFQFLNLVSWSGGDTLMISVIPVEGGKPTSILDKVKIRDGSCCWEKPVYETMKVTRDPKTGKINERLYHVVFSTGLSKFGLLGEVSINFVDYALATNCHLYLFLSKTRNEAILHVITERIQDFVGPREFEDGENLKDDPKDQSLRAHLSNSDIHESFKTNDSEGNEDRFSVYVHASKENPVHTSHFFADREIRSEKVVWGGISMIDAERRLLANALKDPDNQHFVLLSDSCVPLHDFDYVYNYLMYTNVSYIDKFRDLGPHGNGRYSERMLPEVEKKDFHKGAQWFTIKRQHALIITADSLYYTLFRDFCKTTNHIRIGSKG